MKKFITAIVVMVMSLALCFSFVGCANGNDSATILEAVNKVIESEGFEEKVNELVEYYTAVYGGETPTELSFELPDLSDNTAGTLTVGTEAGFAPFEFVDGDEVVGVDIAIMQMVAEELNFKLEVMDMNFDSLPAALASGKIDIIAAGFTKNEEREETMSFSKDYFTSQQFIVCATDAAYETLADLAGLTIGVQMGTTGDFLVSDEYGDSVKQYKSITLAMEALKKGELDVIVIDELPAKSLVNVANSASYKAVKMTDAEPESYGFAVKKV